MNPIEQLLQRKWIIKNEDPNLYFQIKDSIKGIRKQFQEKLGYSVILTPQLIKLEKIPGYAEVWMGIQSFQSVEEYQMYCCILMFLEEKEREEQFVLSSLTEYIQMQFPDNKIDWTSFTTRRQLVRVIKYCLSIHLFELNDGNEDLFVRDYHSEVLYENTGYSRYVLRNFSRDIMEYKSVSDFAKSEWIDMEEDRGIVRKQRVYRRLLLSPGVYRENINDEDFQYIRNYRNQINQDFQNYFPCELQVHRSSAYLKLEEESSIRSFFPSNNTISDLVLYICDKVRNAVKKGVFKISDMEKLNMNKQKFLEWEQRHLKSIMDKLPKKYQEMGVYDLSIEIFEEMKKMGFLLEIEDTIVLYPICGKIGGIY